MRPQKLYRLALLLIIFVTHLSAASYSLELTAENTKIQWTLGDVLHTVHGTFRLTSGRIDFDTVSGKASGRVVVDALSGASGDGARDRRMHANVLESKNYPEATFTPSAIDGTISIQGSSTVKVRGTLAIHGASHEVTMNVQTSATGSQMHATMTFDIPYVAWGMKDPGNFLLKVNKAVSVSIETDAPLHVN